jgi:PAS domain S-box-containing protein
MFNLRRYFSITSAIAIVMVTVVLVVQYHQRAFDELAESSESKNIILARAFSNTIWPHVSNYVMTVTGLDGDALRARPETAQIHAELKRLTAGLPVLKVKIYNLQGLTVYSSQYNQMGADKSNNLGFLKSAREGKAASKQSHRETFATFSGTVRDRNMFESYIPIWGSSGEVEGVFELYTDVTPLVKGIQNYTVKLVVGLLAIFGLLYAILYGIVFRADKILREQYNGLQESEAAIKQKNTALEAENFERQRAEKALRASEAKFEDIASSVPGIVFQFKMSADHKPSFTYVSPAVKDILNLKPTDIVKDPNVWFGIIHPDDRLALDAAILESHRTLQPWAWEGRINRPAGETGWYYHSFVGSRQDDGCVVWNGLVLDITKEKQAESSLIKAQKLEAVGQLTGGVAHDFNNLLAIIMGNTEILQDQPEDSKDLLDAIYRAATRGSELTQRLLAFSRRQPLRPQAVDVDVLVDGMGDLLRRTLGEIIEVSVTTAPGLWRAEVDSNQLESALLNVALNARDAMPEGGALCIECENLTLDDASFIEKLEIPEGDYIRISISDTGTGMSEEILSRALEPFFTTKDVGEGSGLGLPMIYGFAKQSGGALSITSEVGSGTHLHLFLPRAREKADQHPLGATTTLAAGQGESILVVEDEPEIRKLTETVLRSLGYATLTAKDGAEGLAVFENGEKIDLLLSDVVLPGGISGPELAVSAVRLNSNLKVLFMSGYAESLFNFQNPLPEGADLLQKPFRRTELAQKLRAVLDGE